MALPAPVERLWDDLQATRREVLKEIEGLSQTQADWRPGDKDWSIGEIIHHLTLGEINTGKLTTKLMKEAQAAGKLAPYPPDLTSLTPLAPRPGPTPETPPHIWPEKRRPIDELLADFRSTRERSHQSIERLGSVDPRPLTWKHETSGQVLDLSQWWHLMVVHDRLHLPQIRTLKASQGLPQR